MGEQIFREQGISIFAKLALKYRHTLHAATAEAPAANAQSNFIHLYHGDEMLHSVRPSVPCLRFIQIRNVVETLNVGDIMQDTSNWDSHRFND